MRATLHLLAIPFLLFVFASAGIAAIRVDGAFPGSNIIVDSINLNSSVNTNPLFGRIATAAIHARFSSRSVSISLEGDHSRRSDWEPAPPREAPPQ